MIYSLASACLPLKERLPSTFITRSGAPRLGFKVRGNFFWDKRLVQQTASPNSCGDRSGRAARFPANPRQRAFRHRCHFHQRLCGADGRPPYPPRGGQCARQPSRTHALLGAKTHNCIITLYLTCLRRIRYLLPGFYSFFLIAQKHQGLAFEYLANL